MIDVISAVVITILLVTILAIIALTITIYGRYLRYRTLFYATFEKLEDHDIIKTDYNHIYVANDTAHALFAVKPYTKIGTLKVDGIMCDVYEINDKLL